MTAARGASTIGATAGLASHGFVIQGVGNVAELGEVLTYTVTCSAAAALTFRSVFREPARDVVPWRAS